MKELNRPFDKATAKKLLNEYGEKVVYYMKENQSLKAQLDEMKITLDINKEMLYNEIAKKNFKQASDIILNIKSENKRLEKLNSDLHSELAIKEKKLYQIEQQCNDESYYHQLACEEKKELTFVYENKLKEKESVIKQLRQDIMKYHLDDSKTELHVITEPTKALVDLNNELSISRSLIVKYSHLFNQAAKKGKEQSEEIKRLKNIIVSMKKGRKIKKNLETISTIGYLVTESEDNDSNEDESDDNDTKMDTLFFPKHNYDSSDINKQKQLNAKGGNENASKHKRYKSAIIPKLDLSSILSKYKLIQQKDIKIKENKVNSYNDDEYIEKLKYQLAVYQVTIAKNKKTISKLKKIICVLKSLYLSMQSNNQKSTSKETTTETKKSSIITLKNSRILNDYIVSS